MIKPKIPTDAPTRVLSSKITLRWPHQRGKPPTRALQTPKVPTLMMSRLDNPRQLNQPLHNWLSRRSVFANTDRSCDQHLSPESGRIVFARLPEVRGLGLFLFRGPCWTCFFGWTLWSCCYLTPSKVVWMVGLCRDQVLLADLSLGRFHRKYILMLLICVGLVILLPTLLLPHQLSLLHSPFVVCIRHCILLYLRV